MLLYLTSNQKSNLIDPAVRNMTLPAKKLVGRFSLKSFVTKDMRNYANAKFFVVDAACIEESGNDFTLALQSFQMMFSARIIVILSGYEDVNGEVQRLLSIGVVNLVTGETMEDALDELTEALSEDGMQRYVVKAPVYEQPATQREKAPEPDEIIPYRWNARNIRIAVAGSQRRSGVTVTAFIRMKEKGFSFQSISNYKRSLRAAFFIAIEDDCVRKNPFSFALNKVLEDNRGEKTVLTPEQEVSLIDFVQNDKVYRKYVDELIILLGTGLRISEFCGLTTNLDFKNRLIRVDHQLLRDPKSGYYIETPKTKSGYREIPMSEPVYQALKRVVKNRGKKTTIMIDGYTNFLFLKRDGTPKVGMDYNNMIRNLLKKYNKQHKEPLPNITPHSFRHTFCTRMANAGMNPKALQYIMGHANITMTLDYYTHVDACSVRAEMERLAA